MITLDRAPVTAAPSAAARARPVEAALRLLHHEAEIRRFGDEAALLHHLVNEIGGVVPCGQVMLWRRRRSTRRMQLAQVAGLTEIDRDALLVRALEDAVAALSPAALGEPLELDLAALAAQGGVGAKTDATEALLQHPHRHALWAPLKDRAGAVDAGVLFLRESAFSAGELTLLKRLAETYAHAWGALPRRRGFGSGLRVAPGRALLGGAGLVAALCWPVRLSVMAPVEVVADRPVVVTSPINGVIRSIAVAPNSAVAPGALLLQFEDIQPRNEMVLAQQRLSVARARDLRTGAAAFRDPAAAHEMAIARAEYELARVSHDYAVQVLARTSLTAPAPGVAIYTDRRDWEGRAVQVGEEIMQVADPARVAYRVDLSTANGIRLDERAPVDVFLDSAPLGGLPGRLRSVSYTPKTAPGGLSNYTVLVDPAVGDASTEVPRIGARGTARLYGERVPLAVQLLRRPVVALRQTLGF